MATKRGVPRVPGAPEQRAHVGDVRRGVREVAVHGAAYGHPERGPPRPGRPGAARARGRRPPRRASRRRSRTSAFGRDGGPPRRGACSSLAAAAAVLSSGRRRRRGVGLGRRPAALLHPRRRRIPAGAAPLAAGPDPGAAPAASSARTSANFHVRDGPSSFAAAASSCPLSCPSFAQVLSSPAASAIYVSTVAGGGGSGSVQVACSAQESQGL